MQDRAKTERNDEMPSQAWRNFHRQALLSFFLLPYLAFLFSLLKRSAPCGATDYFLAASCQQEKKILSGTFSELLAR